MWLVIIHPTNPLTVRRYRYASAEASPPSLSGSRGPGLVKNVHLGDTYLVRTRLDLGFTTSARQKFKVRLTTSA